MIKIEKMSYSFPEKDLYKKVSCSMEDGQHAVLIGSNGTGKTTLIDMLMHEEDYLYDGKIQMDTMGRIGYVSQSVKAEKNSDMTVYEFLSEKFRQLQKEIEDICVKMGYGENLEEFFELYQKKFDEFQSMDGDHYDSNIKKQLYLAGLSRLESLKLSVISGGEYKLVQVVQQMLQKPDLLIMDEPDMFLDFENLTGLCHLINSYEGTLLVVTHNRYLLNHCFDKVLHLENGDIQEFEGSFTEYNFALLKKKIELYEQAEKETAEIERNRRIVERMREAATNVDSATRGSTLKARASLLKRLETRRIKAPFVDIREPKIQLPCLAEQDRERVLLKVTDYEAAFDEQLLEHVSFEIHAGEKIAIVGPNGTGKTTMLREIAKGDHAAVQISENVEVGFLSQVYGEMLDENLTILETFQKLGFEKESDTADYLRSYGFLNEGLERRIKMLSGGEKNMLQIARIACSRADLLLLDEPTSHLDMYAQIGLEKALMEYKGAVLMVSHDFYHIVNCMDAVLFVEDHTIRKMRIRTFRQKVYEDHFDKKYLEAEQKRKELELRVAAALKNADIEKAKDLCDQLESVFMM